MDEASHRDRMCTMLLQNPCVETKLEFKAQNGIRLPRKRLLATLTSASTLKAGASSN